MGMVDVWEEGTWKIGVTLEKTEYFVYKTVCAQYRAEVGRR